MNFERLNAQILTKESPYLAREESESQDGGLRDEEGAGRDVSGSHQPRPLPLTGYH